jgi:hypothetical protein
MTKTTCAPLDAAVLRGEAWITIARSPRSSANAMPKSRGRPSAKPSQTSIVRLLDPAAFPRPTPPVRNAS